MGSITDNIIALRNKLPHKVSVIAVSKTRTPDEVLEAYNAGQRIFGENRVQELITKAPLLPADIQWHLIGHLQSNKVKLAVPIVSMIESVDSVRLLSLINYEAEKNNKIVDCLMQVHIACEETKEGFDKTEIEKEKWDELSDNLPHIRICGVMGIATFTEDIQKVRSEFRELVSLYRSVKARCFSDSQWFNQVSMGMSGDWEIAVEEGSTMIRVGTIIFGERKNK